VPDFFDFWKTNFNLTEQWSGEATLKALAKIQERYPIETGKLLLHGYGYGAGFVERFALWKPELCAAVSAHSTDAWEWREAPEAGLHPLSDMSLIPFFVTAGENDGGVEGGCYGEGVRFSTFARGAGVPLIWKLLPHTVHRPSAEMEKMAQVFLADALDGTKGKEHFTGDQRTYQYYPAGDKRIAGVPAQYRTELASREFADLWGREAKR